MTKEKIWMVVGFVGVCLAVIGFILDDLRPWNVGRNYVYNNIYVVPILLALCILMMAIGINIGLHWNNANSEHNRSDTSINLEEVSE